MGTATFRTNGGDTARGHSAAVPQAKEPTVRTLIPAVLASSLLVFPAAASNELQLIEAVGLVRAVNAAEQATGGRAIEAEYDDDSGGFYAVDVVEDGTIRRVMVDARTGTVGATKTLRTKTLWTKWTDRAALRAATAGRPLGELLQSAESATSGRVTDVRLTTSKGRVFYDVETVTSSGPRSLVIDPASGTALLAEND
jgi:uncharacterized membrane protein YkoI